MKNNRSVGRSGRAGSKRERQGSEWSAEDWLGLARPGQNESDLIVEIRLTGQS